MLLLGWKPKDFDLRYGLLEVGNIHFWKEENFESTQSLLRVDSVSSPSRLDDVFESTGYICLTRLGEAVDSTQKIVPLRMCVCQWRKSMSL